MKPDDFEQLMLPHLDALYRMALSMTHNPSDADDLVQDTYLRAFQFSNQFRVGTNARAWLFRILTNLFINQYRKKVREPERFSMEASEDFFLYNRLSDLAMQGKSVAPAEEVIRRLQAEAIRTAIDNLPDEYRETVLLADVQEFRYQEVAEILGIPIGTVRSRLSRGRRLVQKAVWELIEETPK